MAEDLFLLSFRSAADRTSTGSLKSFQCNSFDGKFSERLFHGVCHGPQRRSRLGSKVVQVDMVRLVGL